MFSNPSTPAQDTFYTEKNLLYYEDPEVLSSAQKLIKREEKISFKSLIVPMGMRSSYWNYFGFPSEDGETFITRTKVVCALCKTVLAYNKNTTNLKSHLSSKHRNILSEKERKIHHKKDGKRIKKASSQSQIGIVKTEEYIKTEYDNLIETSSSHDDINFEPGEIDESLTDKFIIVEHNDQNETVDGMTSDNVDLKDFVDEVEDEEDGIDNFDSNVVDQFDINCVEQLIIDMIVTDLMSFNVIYGTGFQSLLKNLTLSQDLPNPEQILNYFSESFCKRKLAINDFISNKINNKCYSLSLDKFTNIDTESFLIISINLIEIESKMEMHDLQIAVDVSKIEMRNHVIDVVKINNQSINYGNIFSNLNLSKCAGITNNFNDDDINLIEFCYENNKILLVPCFIRIIRKCIEMCFKNNLVINLIEKIFYVIEENKYCDINDKNNWIVKWDLLSNLVIENNPIVAEYDNIELIVDCLNPLKVTLNLLEQENIPNSSLIKPLATQLIENHFSIDYDNDSELVQQIKDIVRNELEFRISRSPYLSVSSFLDPRFTSLLNISEVKVAREFLHEKFEQIISTKNPPKTVKCLDFSNRNSFASKSNNNFNIIPSQKLGLDYFFNGTKPKSNQQLEKFDKELNKFLVEEQGSLEQCPITWWTKEGYMFPNLAQLANIYSGIPACVSNKYKVGSSEYVMYLKRRYLLSSYTEKVLFLNLTNEIQEDD